MTCPLDSKTNFDAGTNTSDVGKIIRKILNEAT